MSVIQLTIPDDTLPRVIDALCGAYGYDLYKETGGTQTKAQFAKQVIVQFVKNTVRNYEGNVQAEAARQTAQNDVDQTVSVT